MTGCSTGFGRDLARVLPEGGYRVVVTARDAVKIADLAAAFPQTALPLTLDVDQPAQIAAATQAALEKFGRIDVLVNNAGFGYLSAIEEGEDAEIRAMFETENLTASHRDCSNSANRPGCPLVVSTLTPARRRLTFGRRPAQFPAQLFRLDLFWKRNMRSNNWRREAGAWSFWFG